MTSSEGGFTQAPPSAMPAVVILEDEDALARAGDGTSPIAFDPGLVVLTCANCGAAMDERKCKLICRCGYFLSCSDYY